jgi:hypothetical protein
MKVGKLAGNICNVLVFISGIVVNAGALTHFQIADTTTGNNMLVIVDTNIHPNINGINLIPGDEIGVFNTTGLCVGAGRWLGSANLSIAVYGQNTYSSTTDGMSDGEKMRFRIWDSLYDMEAPVCATYGPFQGYPPDSTYIQNSLSFLASLSGTAAPAAPELAMPANGAVNQSASSLEMSWSVSAWAASYELEISTAGTFGTTIYNETGASLTSATITGLSNSTTYYWRVNASNADSSNWSGSWSFTTILAAPVTPSLASPASGTINEPVSLSLNWDTVPGAVSYALAVSTAADFGSTVSSRTGLTGASASMANLAGGTTYYWEVNAANIGGASLWSSAWSFTTLVNVILPVDPGWNMISFNIRPTDTNCSAIFGDSAAIANRDNFILIKDLCGGVYCPTLEICDSLVMQTGKGYQLYSCLADTVRAEGSAIAAFSTPIPLLQGWNLLGYLPRTNLPIATALSGVAGKIWLVKDNNGDSYWPSYGIDNIDSMIVGQGYFAYMTEAASFTYSGEAKRTAYGASLLRLPEATHYAKHANTGNNATILATLVSLGNKPAPDSCEIGAFDGSGRIVGSGTVIHGLAAFPVWGRNSQTSIKDGLGASEPITFKLWNRSREYPVDFKTSDGRAVRYSAQGILLGSFAVPEGALVTEFKLARVYPNPFHGLVQIAFDVPATKGFAAHEVEVNIFGVNGTLVNQPVHGKYSAGHYVVSWSGESMGNGMAGPGEYVIQMKADNFDKKLKIVKIQ